MEVMCHLVALCMAHSIIILTLMEGLRTKHLNTPLLLVTLIIISVCMPKTTYLLTNWAQQNLQLRME